MTLVEPLRVSGAKAILRIFLAICTIGLFEFFLNHDQEWLKVFYFSKASLDDATHYFVYTSDKRYRVEPRVEIATYSGTPSFGFYNRHLLYLYKFEINSFVAHHLEVEEQKYN